MSSTINGAAQSAAQYVPYRRAAESGAAPNTSGMFAGDVKSGERHDITDMVEISDKARELSNLKMEANGQEEPPVGMLEPAKRLEIGSGEHDAFNALMRKVKGQKSDVMSRIQDTLERNGIKLSKLGKIKIEVDSGGRIVVGGLKDKNMAKKVEAALNDESGLAAAVADYRKNEKEFSRQVKDYTGATLYELGMAARGQINSRIEEKGGYQDKDFYERLGFIGMANQFINVDDVRAFSFDGNIDFSGEISVMSNPESGIEDAMGAMFEKATESFAKVNAETLERLRMEAGGGPIDEEKAKKLYIHAEKAEITVDSRGEVKIEGEIAKDPEMNARAKAIIEELVKEMLAESGTNSYGINLFSAGAEGFLEKMRGEGGSPTRVVANMQGGQVVKISADDEGSTGSAREGLIQDLRRNAFSRIL